MLENFSLVYTSRNCGKSNVSLKFRGFFLLTFFSKRNISLTLYMVALSHRRTSNSTWLAGIVHRLLTFLVVFSLHVSSFHTNRLYSNISQYSQDWTYRCSSAPVFLTSATLLIVRSSNVKY